MVDKADDMVDKADDMVYEAENLVDEARQADGRRGMVDEVDDGI